MRLNVEGWDGPIVLAPLAGGPSTPALAAAVSNAGGLGFLAGGYLTPDQLDARLEALAARTDRPYGVNLFCPPPASGDAAAIGAYRDVLRPLAAAAGVELGEARFDDDNYDEKVALVTRRRAAVVSFTFGCPAEATIERCQRSGARVWVTVTDVDEATTAAGRGADALVAQGAEAGGHRGSFLDDDDEPATLLDLLADILAALPTASIVATGGLMTGGDAARVLAAGAAAAQLGTAFLRCPEAGTSDVHRRALLAETDTVLTRAFTGRLARASPTPGPRAWADRRLPPIPSYTTSPRLCVPTVAPSPILTSSTSGPEPATRTAVTYPPATSSPRSQLNCALPVDCRRRARPV